MSFVAHRKVLFQARDKRPAILYAILLAYNKLHRFLLHVVISNPAIQVQPEYPESRFLIPGTQLTFQHPSL